MSRKLLRWRRQALEKHEKMVIGDLHYGLNMVVDNETGHAVLIDQNGFKVQDCGPLPSPMDLAEGKRRHDKISRSASLRAKVWNSGYPEEQEDSMGDPKNHIVEGLPKAIREAKKIARRPDQKADRKERVGIFVTCLRRHLVMMKNHDAYNLLADVKLWYDIGVLAQSCTLRVGTHKVALADLRGWVAEAQLASSIDPFNIDDIDDELAELRHEIYGMQQINLQMERINRHAESVSEQIMACFQG